MVVGVCGDGVVALDVWSGGGVRGWGRGEHIRRWHLKGGIIDFLKFFNGSV